MNVGSWARSGPQLFGGGAVARRAVVTAPRSPRRVAAATSSRQSAEWAAGLPRRAAVMHAGSVRLRMHVRAFEGIRARLRESEPDGWQNFYTERYAAIPDRRLAYPSAISWWAALLAALWSLVMAGGYLELDEELRGVIRPRLNNRPSAEYHKVEDGSFTPYRSADVCPDYCHEGVIAGNCSTKECLVDGCVDWDPHAASRTLGPGAIFVATRLQERQQVSVCHPQAGPSAQLKGSGWGRLPKADEMPACRDRFMTEWAREAFLQAVEEFVLQVDGNIEAHNFAASSSICSDQIAWKHDNKDLDGVLMGPTPVCQQGSVWDLVKVWNCFWNPPVASPLPNGTSPANETDKFPLHMWLAAANVTSLDVLTDARKVKPGLDTFRHEGMVLEVSYEYSNTDERGISALLWALVARLSCSEPAPFKYKITVERVAGSEFKMEEVVQQEQGCDMSCPPESTDSDRDPTQPDRCCGTQVRVSQRHSTLVMKKTVSAVLKRSLVTAPDTPSPRLAVQVRPLWQSGPVLLHRDPHPHPLCAGILDRRQAGA